MPETPHDPNTLEARFKEVVAQFLQQREQGRDPDPEHYLQSFPELATRLGEFFAGQQLFDRLAPKLATPPAAPAQGGGPDAGLAPGTCVGDFELLRELGRG